MATGQFNRVIRFVRAAALFRDCEGASDGQLLQDFLSQRDEAAFEALVRRHGPMVRGVCQRILRNAHDVDDAFQAVFLILVRKGRSLRSRDRLGSWLHTVAYHTALKAKAAITKRRTKESQVEVRIGPDVSDRDAYLELRPMLDRELYRLPDKYREPVLLCDLEGRTRREVARQLGIPEGTLSSRLAMARRKLAQRLARHGAVLSGGALAVVLSQQAATAAVPAQLVGATVNAATLAAAGPVAAGVISAKVIALTEGVLSTMFWTKCKIVTLVLLAAGLLAVGSSQVVPVVSPALAGIVPGAAADRDQTANPFLAPAPDLPPEKKPDDRPVEELRTIGAVGNGDKVTLEGRVKKLVIGAMAQNSEVVAKDDFEAEEIEIGAMDHESKIILKISNKKSLQKMTVATVHGGSVLDLSEMDNASIEISTLGTNAKVTVKLCKDFSVKSPADASSSVQVNYYGQAECAGDANNVKLTKVEAPK